MAALILGSDRPLDAHTTLYIANCYYRNEFPSLFVHRFRFPAVPSALDAVTSAAMPYSSPAAVLVDRVAGSLSIDGVIFRIFDWLGKGPEEWTLSADGSR